MFRFNGLPVRSKRSEIHSRLSNGRDVRACSSFAATGRPDKDPNATKHPKYRQLSDYNKRNAFDIEKYRQHKLVVKPDDTFDLYDMGEVEAD